MDEDAAGKKEEAPTPGPRPQPLPGKLQPTTEVRSDAVNPPDAPLLDERRTKPALGFAWVAAGGAGIIGLFVLIGLLALSKTDKERTPVSDEESTRASEHVEEPEQPGTSTAKTEQRPAEKSSEGAFPSEDAMVLVPAGEFLRGSSDGESDEKPSGRVYVDAFEIDRTEVTVDAYAACVGSGACTAPSCRSSSANWGVAGRGQHPVNCVRWTDADAYCRWAGKRLPTEAEWEKAARGTDGRKYPWGNEAPSCRYAVMDDGGNGCGKDRTWPVGSKPAGASPYGALDMSGNVWEWVSDWYSSSAYAGAGSARNPKGPSSGSRRVSRGGSFNDDDAADLRAANRYDGAPSGASVNLGFRCARSMP